MKPSTPEYLRRLARVCEVRAEKRGATHRHWLPRLPLARRWAVVVIRESTRKNDAHQGS